jgi:hypothetical protein
MVVARVSAIVLIRLAGVDHKPVTNQPNNQQADRFGTGDTIHSVCPPPLDQVQQWAASSVIMQQLYQQPYCKKPTNKMPLYT